MPAKEFFLPFAKKEQTAKDTYSFFFDLKQTDFSFLPGQYIRMILPHDNVDERGTSRFFTVASSPLQKEYLMITTKVIQSSFKKTLAKLTSGTQVKFFGPIGNFVLYDTETTPLVFLAGGIGITPFHSMLTYAASQNLRVSLSLFVSFSTPEEMIFYDELTNIAKNHPNIKVVYTVTKSELAQEEVKSLSDSAGIWRGEMGRISEELLRKYITDLDEPNYYLVGPPKMVEGAKALLASLQIPEEKILTESFTGY